MSNHEETHAPRQPGALSGLRVLDCATLIAGPTIATLMGDFGAEVIKVEHPTGDALRSLGAQKDGVSLWWATANRNKQCVTLDFSKSRGQEVLRELVAVADVIIEGFRPGKMESWGLGFDELSLINPKLIMVRVSGFGQTGPYRDRPGYGTLAEAMSGFASINGHEDGPPTLPPFALGDSVAALYGTFATIMALRHRDATDGRGQIIDLSIYEPLFSILGPQALAFDQLGVVQERAGNRASFTSLRNAFLSRDHQWLALSASSQSIANRLLRLVGREDIAEQEWFQSHIGRVAHQDELDSILAEWIGTRDADEVLRIFEEQEAAIAPIYSIADIFADPQYQARETIVTAAHPTLGLVKVNNVVPKLSRTPGQIRSLGGDLGGANEPIFVGLLGHSSDELAAWAEEGVIAAAVDSSPAAGSV